MSETNDGSDAPQATDSGQEGGDQEADNKSLKDAPDAHNEGDASEGGADVPRDSDSSQERGEEADNKSLGDAGEDTSGDVSDTEKTGDDVEKNVEINFGPNADRNGISDHSIDVLKNIAKEAGETSIIVTSTTRSPEDQARIMYNNCETHGADSQKNLYGPSGDKVVEEYEKAQEDNKGREETIEAMKDKINEVGPQNVSRHCGDPTEKNVVDVAPSSVTNNDKFKESAEKAEKDGTVEKYIDYPTDPAHHFEIRQPGK